LLTRGLLPRYPVGYCTTSPTR